MESREVVIPDVSDERTPDASMESVALGQSQEAALAGIMLDLGIPAIAVDVPPVIPPRALVVVPTVLAAGTKVPLTAVQPFVNVNAFHPVSKVPSMMRQAVPSY
jgi:hypothetical protein